MVIEIKIVSNAAGVVTTPEKPAVDDLGGEKPAVDDLGGEREKPGVDDLGGEKPGVDDLGGEKPGFKTPAAKKGDR